MNIPSEKASAGTLQRYNTIELMGPQNDIVSPTFDFMYQQIFKPKEQTK